MPIDYISKRKITTHNGATVADTGLEPTDAQTLVPKTGLENYVSFNVYLQPDALATAEVQIWVYDDIIGWIPTEVMTFPRPGMTNDKGVSCLSETLYQTVGITVKTLTGVGATITIRASLVARN